MLAGQQGTIGSREDRLEIIASMSFGAVFQAVSPEQRFSRHARSLALHTDVD